MIKKKELPKINTVLSTKTSGLMVFVDCILNRSCWKRKTLKTLLFKCSSHIQKSDCGGVVAIPCHAPAGQREDVYQTQNSTQWH